MTALAVTMNLELNPWLDLTREATPLNTDGLSATIDRIGLLPNATIEGRASVILWITLPGGTVVAAETTLRMFRAASAALLASPVAELDEP